MQNLVGSCADDGAGIGAGSSDRVDEDSRIASFYQVKQREAAQSTVDKLDFSGQSCGHMVWVWGVGARSHIPIPQ